MVVGPARVGAVSLSHCGLLPRAKGHGGFVIAATRLTADCRMPQSRPAACTPGPLKPTFLSCGTGHRKRRACPVRPLRRAFLSARPFRRLNPTMDEHTRNHSLRLTAPNVRPLSPAMEREAVDLLAVLLRDAACRRAGGRAQNVVPIRPPLPTPSGTPINPPIKQRGPTKARNPSKTWRSAA
jgi:hypothetical protein